MLTVQFEKRALDGDWIAAKIRFIPSPLVFSTLFVDSERMKRVSLAGWMYWEGRLYLCLCNDRMSATPFGHHRHEEERDDLDVFPPPLPSTTTTTTSSLSDGGGGAPWSGGRVSVVRSSNVNPGHRRHQFKRFHSSSHLETWVNNCFIFLLFLFFFLGRAALWPLENKRYVMLALPFFLSWALEIVLTRTSKSFGRRRSDGFFFFICLFSQLRSENEGFSWKCFRFNYIFWR